MSGRVASVFVDGGDGSLRLVGTAYFHGYGKGLRTVFSYASEWIQANDGFALSPQAPLQMGSTPSMRMLGFLSDAAPDRWGRHLIFRGMQSGSSLGFEVLRSLDDVDYLLGVDDWSRMGAMRFSADGGKTFLGAGTNIPKLVALPELLDASRSVSAGLDGWEQIKSLLDAGSSSLGGARPKATVADGDTLLLAKFPSAHDEWDVMAWEAWAQEMAGRVGLRAASWRLERIGTSSVLLEKRFDRTEAGRVAYQSALCALGLSDGAESDYVELGDSVQALSCNPGADLSELFGRMALSVAIHNTDDHLRNHGFLRLRGGWRLAPLFDVNPNPYSGDQRALPMFGECGDAEIEGLRECGRAFGIDDARQVACVRKTCEAFRYWRQAARRLGCPAREVALFEPVIEERLRALLDAFVAG